MFTGIIEEQGEYISLRRSGDTAVITLRASKVLQGTMIGDSIAVNGVCLTVTSIAGDRFDADVMPETLRRSNLGKLTPGNRVNLERAMAADGRFGGHIVAGHVDGTGRIREIRTEKNAVWYSISAEPPVLRYIVEKGSITIDGISLTVAAVDGSGFQVSVIPHTREVTNLSLRKPGDEVNLENDIVGKYVERLMRLGPASSDQQEKAADTEGSRGMDPEGTKAGNGGSGRITMDFLGEHGFL